MNLAFEPMNMNQAFDLGWLLRIEETLFFFCLVVQNPKCVVRLVDNVYYIIVVSVTSLFLFLHSSVSTQSVESAGPGNACSHDLSTERDNVISGERYVSCTFSAQ